MQQTLNATPGEHVEPGVCRPVHPKLIEEERRFYHHLPELLAEYQGKYVALDRGHVVAVGVTEVEALTRADDAAPGVLVLVRKVQNECEGVERLRILSIP